jgi:nitric oxide reductase subunit B
VHSLGDPSHGSSQAPRPGFDIAGHAAVDRVLRWGLFATVVVALVILGWGTLAVYRDAPPIPDRVVSPAGVVLYTGADIRAGKELFQREDLMDFGSLYGNGAYFGPDWNTDYLLRERDAVREAQAAALYGRARHSLDNEEQATVDEAVTDELKTNRYRDGTLTLTDAQVAAFHASRDHYRTLFTDGDRELGLVVPIAEHALDRLGG